LTFNSKKHLENFQVKNDL